MDVTVSFQEYLGPLNINKALQAPLLVDQAACADLAEHQTLQAPQRSVVPEGQLALAGRDLIVQAAGHIQLARQGEARGPLHDVIVAQDAIGGEAFFVYPDGAPKQSKPAQFQITLSPIGYSFTKTGVMSFLRGTKIAKMKGQVLVENLKAGDRVQAHDGKPVQVLWVGEVRLEAPRPQQRPIAFEDGCFGQDGPEKRLRLAPPSHVKLPFMKTRMPMLAPASALVGQPGIRQTQREGPVRYHHFMTERHCLVKANGLWAETLRPHAEAVHVIGDAALDEVLEALGCTLSDLPGLPAAQACGAYLTHDDAVEVIRQARPDDGPAETV